MNAGESLDIEYALYWTKRPALTSEAVPMPLSTRIGDHLAEEGIKVFVVEFGRKQIADYWGEEPEAFIEVSDNAEVTFSTVEKNNHADTWRATLNVSRKPGTTSPVELRCKLRFEDSIDSETWTYQWIP